MKNNYVSIAEVVARVKDKDADAFVELYNNLYQQVYFLALSIVKDQYLAQDVVQETFINVYNSIHTLNNNMTFISWINRITYNCALKMIVKNEETPIDNEQVENVYTAASRDEPLEKVITKEKEQSMMDMILKLSPEYRTALILKYYEGMKLEEIAGCMECSVGTVKSRLSRGKNALRKNIMSSGKLFLLIMVASSLSISYTMRSYAQNIAMSTPVAETILNNVKHELGIVSGLGVKTALASAGIVSRKTLLVGSAILLSSIAGGIWGTAPPSLSIDYPSDLFSNTSIDVIVTVDSIAPVKSIHIISEGEEIPINKTNQNGVYEVKANQNGIYQVEVVSWNGHKTKQNFEVTQIDRTIPTLYWYDWNMEKNIFYCLVEDDLSGIDYTKIYQKDLEGHRYSPVRYNDGTGEVEFQLLEVPFNIILYDKGSNFATYKIESYVYEE